MNYKDLYTYKLQIIYKDSKVKRNFYFQSIFSLYRFMYKQLHKDRVDILKVVRLDV